jgi:hypothetical protein
MQGDLALTYVELDNSTAVVFRTPPGGGGGGSGIDIRCLTCRISKISECKDEVCPLPSGGCDSDVILKCAREKCQSTGECQTSVGVISGILKP